MHRAHHPRAAAQPQHSTTADPYLLAAPLPVLTHAVEPSALLHRAAVLHHVDTARDVPAGMQCVVAQPPEPMAEPRHRGGTLAGQQGADAGPAGALRRSAIAVLSVALAAALAAVVIISHGTWMP